MNRDNLKCFSLNSNKSENLFSFPFTHKSTSENPGDPWKPPILGAKGLFQLNSFINFALQNDSQG